MLIVSRPTRAAQENRQEVDQLAQQIVFTSYRMACGDDTESQTGFDAALQAYRKNFPHVPKSVARQAVAYILADSTPELVAPSPSRLISRDGG